MPLSKIQLLRSIYARLSDKKKLSKSLVQKISQIIFATISSKYALVICTIVAIKNV